MADKYNEVTPKAFSKKKPVKQFSPPQNASDLAAWPPSLQEFVNSLFLRSESLDEPQKAAFGSQIQTLMQLAISQNKVWTNQWHLQQLPVFSPGVPLDLHENSPFNKPSPRIVDKPKRSRDKYDSDERKQKRMARFSGSETFRPTSPSPAPSNGPVVGFLEALEKRYLRLTSEPDPAVVRPQKVLERSLDFVINKYEASNAGYLYINDQLKAIRQDLTVQHIKNDMTIKVYKTHGRLAILNNDLGEFNQCSSQLKQLYQKSDSLHDTYEFVCYRILYLLVTGNYSEVNVIRLNILKSDTGSKVLAPEYVTFRSAVYQALELQTCMTLGEYHTFFKIYQHFKESKQLKCAFHMMKHSMATKQRLLALATMCKAFKKLPVDYLRTELAFDESEPLDEFLAGHALAQFQKEADFDCAAARAFIQAKVDKGNFRKIDIKGQV